jgi:hypothetical protein
MDLIRENYDYSPTSTSDDDDQASEPDGAVHRPSEELVLSCPVGGSDLPDLLSSKTIIVMSSSSIAAIFLLAVT